MRIAKNNIHTARSRGDIPLLELLNKKASNAEVHTDPYRALPISVRWHAPLVADRRKGKQPLVATARCALWLLVAIRDNINQLVRHLGETLAGLTKHTGFDAAPVVHLPAQRAFPTARIPGSRGTTGGAPNATPPSPSALGAGPARALAGLRRPAFGRRPARQRLDHLISAIVSPNSADGD
jgi:hypothetical protein